MQDALSTKEGFAFQHSNYRVTALRYVEETGRATLSLRLLCLCVDCANEVSNSCIQFQTYLAFFRECCQNVQTDKYLCTFAK